MVTGPGLAGATTLELAGARNLWPGENYVLPGVWAEGIVRVDAWKSDH